jgi:UDP-glucose:(heptosyl)LPS alpha-1,3-glucosyltransferase
MPDAAEPMHIGLILEHLSARSGGAEGYALTVARELLRRGHRVSIGAVDGDGLDGATVLLGPLASAPARLRPLAPDILVDWGLNAPADLHRLGGGTHREFQRIMLEALPPPVRVAKRLLYALSPQHQRVARRQVDLLSRPGVHVLAVSRFVASQVLRTVPLPPAHLHVLHNGVDTQRFVPGGAPGLRPLERARLGLRDGDLAFLLVAHNLRLKGFNLLRAVFAAGHGQFPAARLVLLGRHDPGLRAPWFIYAGASTRPENVYAAADVLLHPTYYDACANVVLEALACGLPVVSSDRNGSAEVLTDGCDGRVLPVVGRRDDIRARWLEAVAELASRPELRRELGERARRRSESLTIAAYVDRFEDLLRQVAAARTSRSGA